MTSDSKTPTGATWRDPLSVGFEAHRRLTFEAGIA